MHGYQQDEQGDFQPVNESDEPEAPEHRAQGVGDFFANLFTGGLYSLAGGGSGGGAPPPQAQGGLPGTLSRATQGWVTPGVSESTTGNAPTYPAGTQIHADEWPARMAQFGGWKKGNWLRVHVDGKGPDDAYSWFWIPSSYFIDSKTGTSAADAFGRRGREGRDRGRGRGGREVGGDIGSAIGGGGGSITVTQRTNVYDSPSTGARVVGAIGGSGSVHVPILRRQAGWIQTQPPGWGRSGWIQFGAGAGTGRMPAYGAPAPMSGVSTLSGVAPPGYAYTPSGMAPAPGYAVAYPSYQPAYRPAYQPLPFALPQTPVGGIDPGLLQILLQQAQAQGAEQATLQALLDQLHAGANFAPAVQGMGLDLKTLLQGAGVKLDAAGLPVPAGYMGTDQGGADIYADGGVDPTGGALGDYTDPRSQY
jgi:hypothetical protein